MTAQVLAGAASAYATFQTAEVRQADVSDTASLSDIISLQSSQDRIENTCIKASSQSHSAVHEIHSLKKLPGFTELMGSKPETSAEKEPEADESLLGAILEERLAQFFSGDETACENHDLLKMFIDGDEIDLTTAHGIFESLSGMDWTGEASAKRIFDIAKLFSDGDSEMMDMMRSAVLSAFSQVESSFGGSGSLPKQAYDMLNSVNSLFDKN
mgnify:CR=1 FL=1